VPDEEYIAASARYSAAFEILDSIREKDEKVLIYLEFLEPQAAGFTFQVQHLS
jgi:hypothetical protein